MSGRSSIEGQVAIVTGSTDGIGLAAAARFAREGARVAIMGRNPERGRGALERVQAEGSDAIYVQGDAGAAPDVERLFEQTMNAWGRLDILVNCAGGFLENPDIEEMSEEEWSKIVAWNLTSVYLCCRACVGPMKEAGYGRIVNVSSIAGRDALRPVSSAYTACKSGIDGFTRRLAAELAPQGITVNSVAPGSTLTQRFRLVHGDRAPLLVEKIPAGFIGEPEDLADAIWYLSTPGSRYITGVVLDVNGGQYLN